ncbi:hypothetical protein B5F83_07455 [Muribaculum sp. An289]|uniref:glycogen debranching enzyme N-terminal domain-containing protein n=1 Tax=unclassified Muribaculum TaxID=2622126 RepID=UPI000B394B27|nr:MULTISPECIES: glycogen debranching enzyme N-terminal domain-containing protein [unclassified Muribaculum]OUO36623.1 hypothetical protein B5F83_07455 [Muribaculum sp. An289]OUO42416.1 hypothetical protein B5F81_07800 [Muribaculum sp. An287]
MAYIKFNKSELVNLEYALRRELIAGSSTGSYGNTTICMCNTRKYHALLAVPVYNFDGGRYVLLSSLDETLRHGGKEFHLGIHAYGDIYEPRGHKYIRDFEMDPNPVITYEVGGMVLRKSLLFSPDSNQIMIKYTFVDAPADTTMSLSPFLAFRRTHALTHKNGEANTSYREIDNGVAYNMYGGFPDLNLQFSEKFEYSHNPLWYMGITYSDEYRRGFDCKEDLLVPGSFTFQVKRGTTVVVSASTDMVNPKGIKSRFTRVLSGMIPADSYENLLLASARMMVWKTPRGSRQIYAGYSWLKPGLLRETVIALPGIALYGLKDRKLFEEILDSLIADNQERLFFRTTQIEAPLLLTDTIQQYMHYGADPRKLWAKYGSTLKGILESYLPGKRAEAAMHPNGLIWAQKDNVALTWMNTYIDGRPVNERPGYQVEVNAMWYNAVCFVVDMESRYGTDEGAVSFWTSVRNSIKDNFTKTFWSDSLGHLADYVGPDGMSQETRPNQLYAVALDYSPVDEFVQAAVMRVVRRELLTSRGIRTLSPKDRRYKGVYEGNQNMRDEASYNGCTRPFLLGIYVKAAYRLFGKSTESQAESLIEGFGEDLNVHGIGTFSEIYDGDPPHSPHGAISSALTVAEIIRVKSLIDKNRGE